MALLQRFLQRRDMKPGASFVLQHHHGRDEGPACAVGVTALRAGSDTEDSHCLSSRRLKFKSDTHEANQYKKDQTPQPTLNKGKDAYDCDTKI